MSNQIVVELNDGTTLAHFRVDQDYTDIENDLVGLLAFHHEMTETSGKSVVAYAPCDASLLRAEVNAGKKMDEDFSVK